MGMLFDITGSSTLGIGGYGSGCTWGPSERVETLALPLWSPGLEPIKV
jgi:hypothetical protein